MAVQPTFPVPVVQMGLVEKLVEAEQNHPHVQQLVAQESARQAIKAESEQVPVVDVTEQGKKIRGREPDREKREKGRNRRELPDESSSSCADETDAEAAALPSSGEPWTGNIVNTKI